MPSLSSARIRLNSSKQYLVRLSFKPGRQMSSLLPMGQFPLPKLSSIIQSSSKKWSLILTFSWILWAIRAALISKILLQVLLEMLSDHCSCIFLKLPDRLDLLRGEKILTLLMSLISLTEAPTNPSSYILVSSGQMNAWFYISSYSLKNSDRFQVWFESLSLMCTRRQFCLSNTATYEGIILKVRGNIFHFLPFFHFLFVNISTSFKVRNLKQ